jgi:hypothetical protein
MGLLSLRGFVAAVLLLGCLLGCAVPSPSVSPPLTAAAAKNTLDSWNPNYCKVAEFYGFYKPGEGAVTNQIAYVLMANPSDKNQKPAVYEAQFRLLTPAEGPQRWFLTAIVSHSAGLTRRQGWDNLIIPVKDAASGPAS